MPLADDGDGPSLASSRNVMPRRCGSGRHAALTSTPRAPRRAGTARPRASSPSAVYSVHAPASFASCTAATPPPPAGSSKTSCACTISPGRGTRATCTNSISRRDRRRRRSSALGLGVFLLVAVFLLLVVVAVFLLLLSSSSSSAASAAASAALSFFFFFSISRFSASVRGRSFESGTTMPGPPPALGATMPVGGTRLAGAALPRPRGAARPP